MKYRDVLSFLMAKVPQKINFLFHDNPYLLALFFGVLGAVANLFPIDLAFNIALLIGNAAYIVAASFLRPSQTLVCALISVTPLYFYWGHPFGFLTFGLEAWFISTLRARGWYVLTADLLYWLVIGMPLTAGLIWVNMEFVQSFILFSTFKQVINAVLYTSLASILLFTFANYFQSIKSSHPPLTKSLPQWLLFSFWSISAFLVVSISLGLSSDFGQRQSQQFEKELEINNNHIRQIGNNYLKEHQLASQNVANQLARTIDVTERKAILAQLHQLYPGFLTMLIASKTGAIEVGSPYSLMEQVSISKLSVKDRPYFIRAMQDQALFVSSVFLGRGFGSDPIVAISAPIYANNDKSYPSGIVEGSLNLAQFGLYNEEGHDENDIKIIVTDHNDKIIYASNSLALATLSQLEYDNRATQKVGNLMTLRGKEAEGKMFLYKQAKLVNNWKVYSLIEHKVALKLTQDMYLVIFITLFVTLFLASFIAKRFSHHLNLPIEFIIAQLHTAKKTGYFKDIPFETPVEIQKLYQELKENKKALLNHQNELQEQVLKRTEELNQANQKLTEQVNTDALTGLYNRRYLKSNFAMMQSILSRNNAKLMFVLLDLDFFKNINDSYGHLFGDYCLVEIAHILKKFFYRDGDIVARFGGEEFVVMTPCNDIESVRSRLEELRNQVAKHQFIYEGIGPIQVTASIGVALGSASYSHNKEDWLTIADETLYQAKGNGRNQVVIKEVAVKRESNL